MFLNIEGEGGGSEFFYVRKPTWGKVQNFSNSQSLYRGGKTPTTMSLRVECSRLVFGEVQTLALPRPTAVSLQAEFEAYKEETKV